MLRACWAWFDDVTAQHVMDHGWEIEDRIPARYDRDRGTHRLADLLSPGLDRRPVAEIAGRQDVLRARNDPNDPLRERPRRIGPGHTAFEDPVIPRVDRGR